MKDAIPKIYFSEYFNISHKVVEDYGALDIALVCDNPAFVDPFLVFANPKYKDQHNFIINYLKFLRDKALANSGTELGNGDYQHYYKFPEVKQAWLGYSVDGNAGSGLGIDFAKSLYRNLNRIFANFGKENITLSAHLEKLCLVEEGVGVDKISDFTLNLIKKYILEYTQEFAVKYLKSEFLKEFGVKKVSFNLKIGLWEDKRYKLPFFTHKSKTDYVLLVPQDLLTKEDTWISKNDFLRTGSNIFSTINNAELRAKLNKFFYDNLFTKLNKDKKLVKDLSRKSKMAALDVTVREYPEILDYYIKKKEEESAEALISHVAVPEKINFFSDTGKIQQALTEQSFGRMTSVGDCIERIKFFKRVLESNSNDLKMKGENLQEKQLQLMFKMLTFKSLFDYNSEVNNGRGPIDFIVSMGSSDKTGLEFKLASSSKLRMNLLNQGVVYQEDSNLKHVIKIIFYFTDDELNRVKIILKEIGKQEDDYEIFLVDCRKKESASNVK